MPVSKARKSHGPGEGSELKNSSNRAQNPRVRFRTKGREKTRPPNWGRHCIQVMIPTQFAGETKHPEIQYDYVRSVSWCLTENTPHLQGKVDQKLT